jgi:hypothetical protein
MTDRLATVPAESTAYRPQPMLGEYQEFADTLRVDQVKTSLDPAAGRRPSCALDEASYLLDSASEPCGVHVEVRLRGTVVEERLRQAVGVARVRHPRACARITMARQRRADYEWTGLRLSAARRTHPPVTRPGSR